MDKGKLSGVLLKNFASYAEAMMVKEVLEKSGIKSLAQKDKFNTEGNFGRWVDGTDLFVAENKIEEAREIMDAYFSMK